MHSTEVNENEKVSGKPNFGEGFTEGKVGRFREFRRISLTGLRRPMPCTGRVLLTAQVKCLAASPAAGHR